MDLLHLLTAATLYVASFCPSTEFQVNVRPAGNQCNAAVAADTDGQFLVVWSSYFSSGGRSNEIIARRFAPNGNPPGDEFQINAVSAGNQTEPAVALDGMGYFGVTWQGPGSDGDEDIFVRLFDPNSQPITGDLPVNAEVIGRQIHPRVAASPNGGLFIVWENQPPAEAGNHSTVRGQRLDPNGKAVGPEFWIDEDVYDCRYPDIAVDETGYFVVTWMQDRTNKTICARLYDPNGLASTEPFDVSTADIASVTRPSVAMWASGEFVVVWDGDPKRASRDDIHARCFASEGTALSDAFEVNSLSVGAQQWPQVAVSGTTSFVVVWQHEHDDSDLATDIFARQFDRQGTAMGDEVKLNGYVAGKQRYPDVTLSANSQLMAAWESDDQDESGYGIFACVASLASPVDFNADGTVDFSDFGIFARSWRGPEGDVTGDERADALDLERFCADWLE